MLQSRKIIIVKKILLLIFCCFLSSQKIQPLGIQQNFPVVTTNDLNTKFIGQFLEIFKDPDNRLSIQEILNDKSIVFEKSTVDAPAFGITDDAYWLKLKIRNTSENEHWIFELDIANINHIELYILRKNGILTYMKAGQAVPVHELDIESNQPTFPLTIKKNEILDLYFYVQDPGLPAFPMKLWDEKQFFQHSSLEMLVMGLFFGFLIVMTLYNFFLYLGIKDKSYLYYCLYQIGTILSYGVYRGFGDQYFWPSAGLWWKDYSSFLFSGILAIGLLLFMRNFLGIDKKERFMYRFYQALVFFHLITFVPYAMFPMKYYLYPWLLSCLLDAGLAMYAGFVYLVRGYRPARYYSLAWIILLIGIILIMLKFAGIVPINFITEYGMQIGCAVEVLLMAFALADRISLLREEKEKIQDAAKITQFKHDVLKIQKENFEKDLEKARRIQNSLIPKIDPKLNVASFYLPMESVGGDYFDVIYFKGIDNQKNLGFFISDVSGHGVEAALITVMINRFIVNALRQGTNNELLQSPAQFMTNLNDSLYSSLSGNFISAFYGIIDQKTHKIKFSSASHPPPILISHGSGQISHPEFSSPEISFLKTTPQGPPLGVFHSSRKESIYRNLEIQLSGNSRILFYSDGFTEAIGYDYENMHTGLDSFRHTCIYEILQNSRKCDNLMLMRNLSESILKKTGGRAPDDICAITAEI